MKVNEATWDRVIRVIFGLFLLSFLFWVEGNTRYFGLLGLPYSLLKISTRKEMQSSGS